MHGRRARYKRTSFGVRACAKNPVILVVVIIVLQLLFLQIFHNEASANSAVDAIITAAGSAAAVSGRCCLPQPGCASLRAGCMQVAEDECLKRGSTFCVSPSGHGTKRSLAAGKGQAMIAHLLRANTVATATGETGRTAQRNAARVRVPPSFGGVFEPSGGSSLLAHRATPTPQPTPTQVVIVCDAIEEAWPVKKTMRLACPSNATVTSVAFASFGGQTDMQKGGNCFLAKPNPQCHLSQTMSIVGQLCLGRTNCKIPLSTFNDPCPGKVRSRCCCHCCLAPLASARLKRFLIPPFTFFYCAGEMADSDACVQ